MHIKNKLLVLTASVFLFSGCFQEDVWKQRWEKDTEALTDQLKKAQDEITEQSLNRAIAEAALASSTQQIRSLSAENDKLISEIAELKKKK